MKLKSSPYVVIGRLFNPEQIPAVLHLLARGTKLVESSNAQQRQAIAETLTHWQQDTDLAGFRDEAALAKLPDNERKGWKSLWANVDALLAKAHSR